MTWLLNSRALTQGGPVRPDIVALTDPPEIGNGTMERLIAACRGKDVLIATHGFNVNQYDGVNHLSQWESLVQLPGDAVYLGFLWPGDSVWLHALIYPEATKVAKQAGDALAHWINSSLAGAASVSFVSHSLGARVVLEAISALRSSITVRRLLLMAGAIDANCLGNEYASAAKQIQKISNLASTQDDVLKWAFPLGNPLSGIFADGHPFWKAAIGREAPMENPPSPAQFDKRSTMPAPWNFGHDDYLPPAKPGAGYVPLLFPQPINDPMPLDHAPATETPQGSMTPADQPGANWKNGWTGAFAATRFR